MNKKSKTELKLNFLINEMNCLWGSSFIVGGGSVALILSAINKEVLKFNIIEIIQIFVGLIGIIICLSFINAFFIKRTDCIKYINLMEEKETEV